MGYSSLVPRLRGAASPLRRRRSAARSWLSAAKRARAADARAKPSFSPPRIRSAELCWIPGSSSVDPSFALGHPCALDVVWTADGCPHVAVISVPTTIAPSAPGISWTTCAMTAKTMDDKVSGGVERASSSGPTFVLTDEARKNWQAREKMKKEHHDELQRLREKEPDPEVTPFDVMPFDTNNLEILPELFRDTVVSIGLFYGDMMIFACSGTAVRCRNNIIKECHSIFVTSVNLALEFEHKRKRDDNFKIKVLIPGNIVIYGFLGLFDRKANIAIVTAFNSNYVYHVDTSVTMDVLQCKGKPKLVAAGCTFDGILRTLECSPSFSKDDLVSCKCHITEAALGGPVILFDDEGHEHFAGVITSVSAKGFDYLPTKSLPFMKGCSIIRYPVKLPTSMDIPCLKMWSASFLQDLN